MAFDPARAADNAATYLEAVAPVTDRAKLVAYLTAIFHGMYDEMVANAEILPGTFEDSTHTVITGEGKFT